MRKLYFLILCVVYVSVCRAQAPVAVNDTATLIEGRTDSLYVLANDLNPNPSDSIRITSLIGAPSGWAVILDSTQVLVSSPDPSFYGQFFFSYRACDTRTRLCDTGDIYVNVVRPPQAYSDTATMIQPDTAYIDVTANDSDFNALDSACLTHIWGLPAGWGTIYDCDQIAFAPSDWHYTGTDTFYYSSCYTQTQSVCDTGMVIVKVILPVPQVDFTWTEDSPCVAQVYNSSILADSVIWTVQYLTGNGVNDTLYNVSQFPVSAVTADSGFDVQVCLTGFNSSGDSTTCHPFWIQCSFGGNGITEITTSHFIIYPDPATDLIHVGLSSKETAALNDVYSIIIYDIVGKELKTITFSEQGSTISISDLSPGVYMIALLDKDQNKKLFSKFEVMR